MLVHAEVAVGHVKEELRVEPAKVDPLGLLKLLAEHVVFVPEDHVLLELFDGHVVHHLVRQVHEAVAVVTDLFPADLPGQQALDLPAANGILGLISYLTAGETETRAWTITKGTKAPQAAGKIHSDFERGFIKAEVVYYQDLLDCGSYNGAKEKGLVRMEGKEYVVKDGDVILFRFNV